MTVNDASLKPAEVPDAGAAVLPSVTEPSAADALDQGPYAEGFTIRTVIGAIFVALIMMPASIYIGLVAGGSLGGGAAEWVTIILFTEVARRSFVQLKRQEVYMLYYVVSGIALTGGPFAGCIWNQYFIQAPESSTLAAYIPDWVVPPISSLAIQNRSLIHADWWWSQSKAFLAPMTMIFIGYILGRLTFFSMGYLVFRATSDLERLPFPLVWIGAEGATALAESTTREPGAPASWRWNVFSIGASLGVVWGTLYVLVPVISGLFLAKPIYIFPIPFIDFTRNVESFLPASLVSLTVDIGGFLFGMLLPFPLVTGSFIAMILTGVLGAPILYHLGAFEHWRPGNTLLVNQMLLSYDFWLSVGVGFALAVFLIGIWTIVKSFIRKPVYSTAEEEARRAKDPNEPPYRKPSKQRGDFPLWIPAVIFLAATTGYAWICKVLVPDFPFWIVFVFGFLWTPIQSYISARLIGITGLPVGVPFLRETAFLLSGYKGVDIWFAPIPLGDCGGAAAQFRALEMTRTRFSSLIKAEFLIFPIIFITSFLFWWFVWRQNQIPSSSFPMAARMWPIQARQQYLLFTANSSDNSLLLQALDPSLIGASLATGLGIYAVLAFFGLPLTFFYGLIGGLGAPLHMCLWGFVGGLFGRYYFRKKIGEQKLMRYLPVLCAGFACGGGLAGMCAVAFTIIMQCTKDLPF